MLCYAIIVAVSRQAPFLTLIVDVMNRAYRHSYTRSGCTGLKRTASTLKAVDMCVVFPFHSF